MERCGVVDDGDEGIGSPVALDAEAGKEPKTEIRSKDRKQKRAKENHNKGLKKKKAKALEAKQNQEAEEMRQLESSLFGPIYAPLKFGTELGAAVSDHDRDGPLFFMDRSAGNGEDDLPVYEEDFAVKLMKMRRSIRGQSLCG